MQWERAKSGFTLVELLIVIVVIAILAAVTIVAYNGIVSRSKTTALQSNLSQQAKKLALWKVDNSEQYPSDLSNAQSLGMLVSNSDVTYTKYITSPSRLNYCATGQRSDGIKYSITSDTSHPQEGECVTNLLTNTSVELNTTGIQNIGNVSDRTITRPATVDAQSGAYVFRLTVGPSGGVGGYGSLSVGVPVGRYTGSMWIRSNASVTLNAYFEGSATKSTVVQSSAITLTPGVWARTWRTLDVTVAGTVKVGFLVGGTTAEGNYLEIDSFILTEGSTIYNFYDGESENWFWNGTPHASTSFGIAATL